MKKRLFHCLSLAIVFSAPTFARETTVPVEGLHQNTPRVHALVGATVVVSPDKTIENATVVIRDGLIESVGANVDAPADARIWNVEGKILYPGFIDAYTHFGMPAGLTPNKPRDPNASGPAPARANPPAQSGPAYWNPLITPERDAAEFFKSNAKDAEKLNDLGFATVATFPGRGIFRGQGALVNLNGKSLNESSVDLKIAQHVGFDLAPNRPDQKSAPYPSSLMGSIALIRQALYDAQWQKDFTKAYEKNPKTLERPVENFALSELQPLINNDQFALFHAADELDYNRIANIAEEFSIDFAILGNGYEYRRANYLEESGATLVLPLAFPNTPVVDRYTQTLDLSLEQLQHWEFAPSNLAFLADKGVTFCITTHALSDPAKEFWSRMRDAVKRGLSESQALAALTTRPATLYGTENRLGTIEAGKIANITIASGNLFTNAKAKVAALWIDGDYIDKKTARTIDIKGEWTFEWKGATGFETAKITGDGAKATVQFGDTKAPATVSEKELLFSVFDSDLGGKSDTDIARLQAYISPTQLTGSGFRSDGTPFSWTATRNDSADTEKEESENGESKKQDSDSIPELAFDRYPAGAFGVARREASDAVLVANATIWTSGPDGVLENADLLVRKGKIDKIGRNLKAPRGALEIDAAGKHVTAGLIDAHSHMAMSRGVNESGSAISVEVRAADIINPVNINIYRQLAGGLTTANLLHGSANPMGGQSQVIKLRWGEDADAFKLQGARPGVKFALGENVKQSNWGDRYTTRYPQTRMGVEQFMESHFSAAADYERDWNDYRSGKTKAPPRKNIRLEAALEILRGERDVHIHSYRQDEILMFARMAQRLDLKVAAFQHILEGYKVADAMVDINAGGSTFSDWWAYKFEVYDAIPYNGAMMHRAGVLTSFNSDNAELATRMNTEAAKAVKYGGLSEEEALNFVTINPAIQLGIDHRVGSIEAGKDADFVIWNEHPLSTYASVEQTWVDGIRRFDSSEHADQLVADQQERDALIQKALAKQNKGPKSKADEDSESEKENTLHAQQSPELPANVNPALAWIYSAAIHHYSCSANEEGHNHNH